MKKNEWLDREAMPPLPYMTLCMSRREFAAAMEHLGAQGPCPEWVSPGSGATTHVLENSKGGLVCVVCLELREKREYEQVAALLVHEAVHVWQYYRDLILNEAKPSSELEAYVIQRISQNFLYAYGKKAKRRSGR